MHCITHLLIREKDLSNNSTKRYAILRLFTELNMPALGCAPVTSSIEAGRHNSDHKSLNYQLQIFNTLYFKNSFTSLSSATSSSSSATPSLSSSSSVTSVSKYVVFYTYHAFVSYDVFIIGDVFSIVNDVIITKTPLTLAIY